MPIICSFKDSSFYFGCVPKAQCAPNSPRKYKPNQCWSKICWLVSTVWIWYVSRKDYSSHHPIKHKVFINLFFMYLYYKNILQRNDSKKEKNPAKFSFHYSTKRKTATHSQFLFIVFKSIFKSFLIVPQYYGVHLALACGQMIKCLCQPH